MQLLSEVDDRTFDLTPISDPVSVLVRDVANGWCILAQWTSEGALFGLDQAGDEVDQQWIARVLASARRNA